MLDIDRAVEVKGPTEGTGYLIGPSLILTAWHVIDPGEGLPPNHQAVPVRILGKYMRDGGASLDTQDAEVIWPVERPDRDYDFALLKFPGRAGAILSNSYGRLPDSGMIDVRAVGFPDFAIKTRKTGSDERDTHEISAKVMTGTGRKQREAWEAGTFEILLRHEDVPTTSHQLWEGMSGAAVFSGGHCIGVIQDAGAAVHTHKLLALPVDRLFRRAEVQSAIAAAGLLPPKAVRSAPRSEEVIDFLHLLDRTQISQELQLELDGFFDEPTRPRLLAIRARSDDDLASLYRRIRERDLESYGGEGTTFLPKEILWPSKASSVDRGRLLLEQELKNQLVFNRGRSREPLQPKEVLEGIPGSGTTLFLYSTLPTTSLSAIQIELIKWWETLWSDVAALGGRIVVLLTFEEQVSPAECCTSLALQCQGLGPPRDNVLPEGVSPSWQLLPRPGPIEFDDVDAWIRSEDEEASAWRSVESGTRAQAANAFAKKPRLPRGLRCVRLCMPNLMEEIADD